MEKAEKIGLGVAAAGHVVLFGILSLNLLFLPDNTHKPQPIEVTIADEVGLESSAPNLAMIPPATSVAEELGDPDPADISMPEPAELTPAPQIEPTRPQPAPAAEPKPKPKAVPKEKPKPKAQPADKPKAAPKEKSKAKEQPADAPKPKPKGSRLGKDFLKGITDQSSLSRNQNATGEKASANVVASLQQELYRQIKRHWKPPTGTDAELLRTKVTARLDRDGNIVGTPTASTTGINASNRSQADVHKERAIAAVTLAAPFKTFPEQYYSEWSVIEPVLYLGI